MAESEVFNGLIGNVLLNSSLDVLACEIVMFGSLIAFSEFLVQVIFTSNRVLTEAWTEMEQMMSSCVPL